MGQQEGMHLALEGTEGHISSQVMESKSGEKKLVLEKEQSITFPDKKKCFACNGTSHTLNECRIKGKLVTVAQPFGYATKFPFSMIRPSEEKFYHHCVLITSNISDLDLGIVKGELQKFWKLSVDWELRRECGKNFLASLSSEDDVISCLKHPQMETLLDDTEVKFTVTRRNEGGDEERTELIIQWFIVCGVPRIYRDWKVLYQVASPFGVLIEVDEESLEVGDKEPIRLKLALRSLDGAPFSHHFVFGWSSRVVMFTAEDKVIDVKQKDKELEEMNSKDLDGFRKECEDNGMKQKDKELELNSKDLDGLNKECEGKGMKQKEKELDELNSKDLDGSNKECEHPEMLTEGTVSENSSHNTGIATSMGNNVFGSCSDKERKKELNKAQPGILLKEPKYIGGLIRLEGEIKENKISAPAATTITSKKTTVDGPEAEGAQSIGAPIGQTSTSMIGKEHFRGVPKPHIKRVYERRSKQKVTETLDKIPLNKLEKRMVLENTGFSNTEASTACNKLEYKGSSETELKKELNSEETALMGQSSKSEEIRAYMVKKDNSVAPAATTITSTKQTSEDTAKTERAQLSGEHTKGGGMGQLGSEGVQPHEKQCALKMHTGLLQNAKKFSTHSGIYDSFSKMGLQENLLKGISHYGLEKPSVVHQEGIVPLCKGLSVIQQSLSGTTVTLCCGVLQQLDYGLAECQALILVPTRDLAQETKKTIEALGQFLGVTAHTCTGKRALNAGRKILSRGIQVIVGTPGHMIYMLQRHAFCSDHIRMLLLDEADELLTGGFKDQTCNIIQLLPPKIQVGLFSVSISNEALETSRMFMDNPVTITVPRDQELEDMRIKQYYVKVENEEVKLGKLYDVLDTQVCEQIIIFVNARTKVKSLIEQIRGKGYNVPASHGGLHQQTRDTAVQELQSGSSSILIATDLRGTNAAQIDTVINYDLPTQPMQYMRRVEQQSEQSGREGVTISFVTPADVHVHSKIQRFFKNQIRELPSNF